MKQKKKIYRITKKIEEYISKNDLILEGDKILIGLSGGADSVCLLTVLNSIKEKMKFEICAVHVHHGIREESADRDAEYAKLLCEKYNIPVKVIYKDVPQEAKLTGESIEECARRIRYEVFEEELGDSFNGKIAVAHHMDDQAETVLFRMMRGTGVKGLKAMRPKNGNIIRPLLCVSRKEIIEYLDSEEISYCEDETNEDIAYSRNRIRNLIIPEALVICPESVTHISEIAEEAAEIDGYLEKTANALYEKSIIKNDQSEKIMNAKVLLEAEPIICKRAIKKMIGEMIKSLKDITREHVDEIYRLLDQKKSAQVMLPKNLLVLKEGEYLTFTVGNSDNEKSAEEFIKKVTENIDILLPDKRVLKTTLVSDIDKDNVPQIVYTKWFDYDKIKPDLCIRTRREGDFLIMDSKGSKKNLSRYMIDEKIPKSQRDEIYLLASGSKVYWVIGYRISEDVKITDSTQNILKVEIKGEDK